MKSKSAFKIALKMLSRFSLVADDEEAAPQDIIACLPMVGLLEGLCYWLAASVVVWLVPGPAGGVVCAVVVMTLEWNLTAGKKTRGFIWFLESRRHLPEGGTDAYLQISFFQAAMLVKACCIALLGAAGLAVWLIVPPLLGAAALAELCTDHGSGDDKKPPSILIQCRHWLVAAVPCLIVGGVMSQFVAGLTAVVIGWLLVPALVRFIQGRTGGTLQEMGQRAVMELVEMAMLLLGLLYFSTN